MSCRLGTLGKAGIPKCTTADECARNASEDGKEKGGKTALSSTGKSQVGAHGDSSGLNSPNAVRLSEPWLISHKHPRV